MKVFYSKSNNSSDVQKFKDLCVSKVTTITGLALINYNKKCTCDNQNFATIKIDKVNVFNNDID